MRSILIVVVILLQLLLGWWYRRDYNSCCTTVDSEKQELPSEVKTEEPAEESTNIATQNTVKSGPLLFNWSSGTPILGDDWNEKRQSVLDSLNDNQQLEITGLYRSDEVNTTTFENLGLSRANEVKKLFAPPLKDDRIVLRGKLTDALASDRTNSFESVEFRNLTNTAKIKETDDKTLIYFPYNSTNKLNDTEVEKYLNDVADRVKASGESIMLTGHTDGLGSSASNQLLGQYRADVIKSYLVSRGVSAAKITSQSKGETTPIAKNNTKVGRAQNRRTELQIIK